MMNDALRAYIQQRDKTLAETVSPGESGGTAGPGMNSAET
jgi:hypothetical protein